MPRVRLRSAFRAPASAADTPQAPEPQRRRPTFVLGVGAQKAGTTWLADYLKESPGFDHGYRKEYHVFDALDLPSEEWMRRRQVGLAEKELEAIREGRPADAAHLHRLAMYADTDLYFDYFASLIHRRRRVVATGDLTPDYAMLSPERFTSIRSGFEERAMRTVAVFLLRDPVERVWSHIRMKMFRKPHNFVRSPDQELLVTHTASPYALRTQYHLTLDNLAAAFPSEQVHVGLYERLFDGDDQVRAIAELVGLPFHEPQLAVAKNASPRELDHLPEDIARTVAQFYAETYRGVAERRPDLDIARWWPHAHHVL